MRRTAVAISALLTSLLIPLRAEPPRKASDIRLEKLADGVWAALQPHAKRFDDCNSVIIVRSRDVLVVDAQTDADSVRAVIGRIRELTDRPVRYLINTHWHSDHTQGNQLYREAFGETLVVVGHESLIEDVPGRAATYVTDRVQQLEQQIPQALAQLDKGLGLAGQSLDEQQQTEQRAAIEQARAWVEANRDVRFLAPDLTYASELTFEDDEIEVRLLHVRAHTRGDTVVYLPSRGLLLTGDVVDALPYIGHGYPRRWIAALERFEALDFDTLVPGHGPVFRGRDQLRAVRAYLDALVLQVGAAAAAGSSLDSTRESVDLSKPRAALAGDDTGAQRFFDATVGEAIERAWLEARDELPD